MSATVHKLSRVRTKAPFPAMPAALVNALAVIGMGNMGPPAGYELWGRGSRTYVMIVDGFGAAYSCRFAPSYPAEGFSGHAAARKWARAYFAGLGREGFPELRTGRRSGSSPLASETTGKEG